MTAVVEMSAISKSMRRSPLPLMRGVRVKRLTTKAKAAVLTALRQMNAEAIVRVEAGRPPLAVDAIDRWTRLWISKQREIMGYIAIEGAHEARFEFGLSKTVDTIYVGQTADDFALASYQAPVDEWLGKVASASTRAHATKINSIWMEATAFWDEEKNQGLTPPQIAKRIQTEMPEFTQARARMIAYTNTNWAFNSGIRTEYAKIGVTVLEWMTSEDDATCPWCRRMDEAKVKIDDPFLPAGTTFDIEIDGMEGGKDVRTMNLPFAVDHPPLHPNCACILLPVVV